ncbi:MAG TPA: hypothetical protein VEW28_05355 [Candidatus Kapabacteria bacterium]|nr:hypothetical protein [Candidatus Kapabacteria bacterium]
MSAIALITEPRSTTRLWLRSPRWDLTWVSLSVFLIVVPYSAYYLGQALGFNPDHARVGVNYLIAGAIGGPHMYATYTRTFFEPTFRKRHWTILPMAIIIPSIVIYAAIFHFTYLLTFFFFWASIHVLHQIIFIVDCYNERQRSLLTKYSRVIDYAVVLTALYPMAMYRFVHNTFTVGGQALFFPEALRYDAVWWLATGLFSVSLVLYIAKTIREFTFGIGNVPKTILISVTVLATFFTPFFHELDVAFQGLNSWHSFQYLGLTWYINRLRYERGEISAAGVRKLSAPGKWWKYYGVNIIAATSAVSIIWVLRLTQGYHHLTPDQTYYMIILCFLLTHYYHDHILFRHSEDIRTSEAAELKAALVAG